MGYQGQDTVRYVLIALLSVVFVGLAAFTVAMTAAVIGPAG
jgi:nitrate reductase NapE component